MPRSLPLILLLGGLSALAFWAVLTGSFGGVILAYLAPLPIYFAGLSFGPGAGLFAGVLGTALMLPLGFPAAAMHGIAITLPAALLVRQALLFRTDAEGNPTEWYPPGLLLSWLCGLAAAGVAIAFLLYLGDPGGLPGRLEPGLKQVLGELRTMGFSGDTDAAARRLSLSLPGMLALAWMLLTIANASLAQGLAQRFGMARRPAPRLTEMVLPTPLVIGFAAAAVASMMSGQVGALAEALAFILALPFFFLGCAVVHVAARRTSIPGFALGIFYALLIVLGPMVMLVVLLGVAEQWIGLRRRLSGAGD